MPRTTTTSATARTATILGLAAGATAGIAGGALAQSDPLSEPFPAVLDLADLDGEIGFVLNGVDIQDSSGWSVASAGDLNGDGVDDLVIGAPTAAPDGQFRAGSSFVVFGRDQANPSPAVVELSDLDGANGFRLDGAVSADRSGQSVAPAGDVNHDGVDDLIIGAYLARPGGHVHAGSSYVVYGRDGGSVFPAALELESLDGTIGFRIDGMSWGDGSGHSVASAGDVNGDGIDDMIIGATGAGPDQSGSSFVVFGRSGADPFPAVLELGSLDGVTGFRINGVDWGDTCGFSVSTAGDVNSDGVDDLIIGTPHADPGERDNAGESYVVFGRGGATSFPAVFELSSLDGTTGFRLDGLARGDHVGWAVASTGDLNGDGVDDVVIGAFGADPDGEIEAGSSYVVFGRDAANPFPAVLELSSLDGATGFRLDGGWGDFNGFSVAPAGDMNGDGMDDLAVGSFGADPRGVRRAGSTYVVFGRDAANPYPATLELSSLDGVTGFRLDGVEIDDTSGRSVAPAGDINDDGVDDLIIGAPGVTMPGGSSGSVGSSYVVFGRRPVAPCSADLDGDGALTIFDFLAFQNLFDAMDPAADFDGDGDLTIFDFLAFQNAFDAGCP